MYAKTALLAFALSATALPLGKRQGLLPGEQPSPACVGMQSGKTATTLDDVVALAPLEGKPENSTVDKRFVDPVTGDPIADHGLEIPSPPIALEANARGKRIVDPVTGDPIADHGLEIPSPAVGSRANTSNNDPLDPGDPVADHGLEVRSPNKRQILPGSGVPVLPPALGGSGGVKRLEAAPGVTPPQMTGCFGVCL